MRLQVFLSHNGVCSRRRAMETIFEGRVTVNGSVVKEPSHPIDPLFDRVQVDGMLVKRIAYDYILLHKPCGYVTTTKDPFAQKTVLDLIPKEYRHLVPVGRLDKDTQGLLLLTNDGALAYKLTHPKFHVDKTYIVTINGRLNIEDKRSLEKGFFVDGKKTLAAQVSHLKSSNRETELHLTIHEGHKRQIRYMFQTLGYRVVYLKRIRQGPLTLGDLKIGTWRHLTDQEKDLLKKIKSAGSNQ